MAGLCANAGGVRLPAENYFCCTALGSAGGSNGKILLDHYRHQRRHFAGDDCLYHQPVTATRREKRYRPPRLRYEKAGASARSGKARRRHAAIVTNDAVGEAASGVQVCRRTARRQRRIDHLRQNFVRQHMRARNDWLTRLRAGDRVVLVFVIRRPGGEPSSRPTSFDEPLTPRFVSAADARGRQVLDDPCIPCALFLF